MVAALAQVHAGVEALSQGIAAAAVMGEQRGCKGKVKGAKFYKRGTSAWMHQFVGPHATKTPALFRALFRVPKAMFIKILADLVAYRPLVWGTTTDAVGRKGIPSEIKVLVCLRLIGTARSLQDLVDQAEMGKETIRYYLRQFADDIEAVYGSVFLNRWPTRAERGAIAEIYAKRGMAGCIGAVDCCKMVWKNCPYEVKGQFHNSNDGKLATMSVEAWCDSDLYVYHWFAGRCGTNNDKTMVNFSPLFTDILSGSYSLRMDQPFRISAKGARRHDGYFIVDGIYPPWMIFARPIHSPMCESESRYTKLQEALRKDIERCFGVLQARFQILRKENHYWEDSFIVRISGVCVTLHNMMVRMNQYGMFDEEVQSDATRVDIISQFYDEEVELLDLLRLEVLTSDDVGQDVIQDVTNAHGDHGRPEVDLEKLLVRLQLVQDYVMDQEEHMAMVEEFKDSMTERALCIP